MFLSSSFLLESEIAERLYFEFAEPLPIIDYHNHLSAQQVAENHKFDNLTQIWLDGDHYKWRAMRLFGIEERYITGEADDYQKFTAWAKTVPHTLRNPLYHWTHMELRKPFGIDELLSEKTAEAIYQKASTMLQNDNFSTRSLLKKANIEVICTTDDPLDDLISHQKVSKDALSFEMRPTWRPDNALKVDDATHFAAYTKQLEKLTSTVINDLDDYLVALEKRHDFFEQSGCKIADCGLSHLNFVPYNATQVEAAFNELIQGKEVNKESQEHLLSFLILELARMNHKKDWVQQFHLGALRNNNERMFKLLGADAGFDSIGDELQAAGMSRFFNALDRTDQLAKTIVYNLNPAQNEVFATMMGNFNTGGVRGKMQLGASWWFLDQLDGMEKQINTVSNMGLLSCFVGMLTDSRSFLSFSRHEYFRRLLCNMLAKDILQGKIPEDYDLVGSMIQNICYYNAKSHFKF